MSSSQAPFISGTLRAVKIVLRTFTGVRGSKAHQAAAEGLGPKHFIAAGVIAIAILITVLISLVRFAVSR